MNNNGKKINLNGFMLVFATISMIVTTFIMMSFLNAFIEIMICEKLSGNINGVIYTIINILIILLTVFIIVAIIVWAITKSKNEEKMSLRKVLTESKIGRFSIIAVEVLGIIAIVITLLFASDPCNYELDDEYVISTEIDGEVYE